MKPSLYRPYDDPIWKATNKSVLSAECKEKTPNNLLYFLRMQGKYTVADLEQGCRSYGLHPSSWEYMWKYLHTQMLGLFELTSIQISIEDYRLLSAHFTPFKLDQLWRWSPGGTYPRELFYIEDCSLDQGWSLDWPITVSVVLLSLELLPPRVLRFGKACNEVAQWMMRGGNRPDMKFPYPKDIEIAIAEMRNIVLLEELGE